MSTPPTEDRVSKTGWLYKFSVGRGLFPVKNWQRRWFTVTHQGLNYAKKEDAQAEKRTFIPFVGKTADSGEVNMNPVFLLPSVSTILHPEANDPTQYYFGLRFEEGKNSRILLLRTDDAEDRSRWIRFMSQFLHVGTAAGVPPSHPLDTSVPRGHDPEQLDHRERQYLRSCILNWDEGSYLRAQGVCPNPVLDEWMSEGDHDGDSSPECGSHYTRSRQHSVHTNASGAAGGGGAQSGQSSPRQHGNSVHHVGQSNNYPGLSRSGQSSPRQHAMSTIIPQNEYDCL